MSNSLETRSTGNSIADSLALAIGYAQRLVVGIPDDQFGRFARPGGVAVESNHPAFVLGHLALYPSRIIGQLGGDGPSVAAPDGFEALFSKDAKCLDDVDGSLYPAAEEIKRAFFPAYEA
ncbi:MAG: hypothetical protein KDA61_22235, partial [Planctomycetales bacterium]|nr:hypothetical protein [Planctomycetales bacterium]